MGKGEHVRYIVWREKMPGPAGSSIRALLAEFPSIEILKFLDPDYAVVLMDAASAKQLRERLPDLLVERDVQHRIVSTG